MDETWVPFISQVWAWLLSGLRNNRSLLPSPSTSAAPRSCHAAPGLPGETALMMLVPFISQIPTSPPLFCHRMSDLPSPLRSPVPTRRHDAGGAGRLATPITDDPFISRMPTVPSALSQERSVLPTPLKSAASATLPDTGAYTSAPGHVPITPSPFKS